jgi:hypothetical protein
MKYPFIIIVPALRVNAMALFPFILVKEAAFKDDEVLIRHERIHLRQEVELLIIPFYLLYLFNYLIGLIRFREHDKAYRAIIFEREAYSNEATPNYLKKRKFWAWINY